MNVRLPMIGAELEAARPRTRGDCERGPRPCPWISCRYHLARLDVGPAGELIVERRRIARTLSRVDAERATDELAELVLAMPRTCALDVVDRNPDGVTLEVVGNILDVTRERIRQIETRAIRRLVRRVRVRLGSAVREPGSAAPAPAAITVDVDA